MNLDEIEDDYKLQIQKADSEFLKLTSLGTDIKQAESKYRELTKKIRSKYISRLTKFLEESNGEDVKKYGKNPENYSRFKVDTSSYDLTTFQKNKIKISLFIFRFNLILRESIKEHLSNNFLFHYYRIKIRAVHIIRKVNEKLVFFENIFEEFAGFIKEKTKKFF